MLSQFTLVPTGGKLLAGYMTMMAPAELYKAWRRHYKAQRNPDALRMTIEEFSPWSKVIGSRFHGFMLTAQSLYKAQNKQRFYMTFVARYHGLSQMGSDLMSSLGWLVPSTTYDRGVLVVLESARAIIRLYTRKNYILLISVSIVGFVHECYKKSTKNNSYACTQNDRAVPPCDMD